MPLVFQDGAEFYIMESTDPVGDLLFASDVPIPALCTDPAYLEWAQACRTQFVAWAAEQGIEYTWSI